MQQYPFHPNKIVLFFFNKTYAYQTPIKWTLTLIEKVFLNSRAPANPPLSFRVYALKANGTCRKLPGGSKPTL